MGAWITRGASTAQQDASTAAQTEALGYHHEEEDIAMTGLTTLYGREPVMVLALVQAGLAMLAGFGFDLSGSQMALVMAFSAALLGVLTRREVTPMATLPEPMAGQIVTAQYADVPKIPVTPIDRPGDAASTPAGPP